MISRAASVLVMAVDVFCPSIKNSAQPQLPLGLAGWPVISAVSVKHAGAFVALELRTALEY
jgi:hypothetical protein